MHQKKRKWLFTTGIVLFFMAGGVWYLRQGHALGQEELTRVAVQTPVPEEKTKEEPEDTKKSLPTQLPEVTATPAPKRIMVFVCGAVQLQGVYELTEGSRLYEAVELAGGFTQEADTAYHNLARTVSDGERIYILSGEETKELSLTEKLAGEPIQEGSTQVKAAEEENGRINLNTAGIGQLTALPGIGEAKAESIIEYRTKVGSFSAIEEIMNISGIGEAMFEKIKDKITVD